MDRQNLDINELSKQLIVQSDSYAIDRCGCYVTNQDILNIFKAQISIPLKTIDYQLEIVNSIARVILQQIYMNPTDKFLELEYSTPIDTDICIYKFNAIFGDTEIDGVVKQKVQAIKQYEDAIESGKQAAIGFINQQSPNVLDLKIGNVGPKTQVKIRIQYLYELDINLNIFWRIILHSKIWPRIINQQWKQKSRNYNTYPNPPQYTWSFKVTLNTSQRIVLAQSTTHQLKQILNNQNQTQKVFVLEKGELPNKNFTFIYTTENYSKPTSVYSKTDTSQTLLVSFIPRFNDLQLREAENMEKEGKDYQVSLSSCKGEFIFLLDRSGSMLGQKINKAKDALQFFLKSLPNDSYFNIISFGSHFVPLYDKSVKVANESIDSAIHLISLFSANMSSTQILQPLQFALLKSPNKKDYPKHVFLLTDGQVSNRDSVLQLIDNQSKYSTVYGIGIGRDCSKQLIKGCGNTKRGKYIFIYASQDPATKIIQLLQKALSPIITDFQIEYNEKQIQSIIPNPNQMFYIFKNDPVNLYLSLKPTFTGDYKIKISYTDPITKKQLEQTLVVKIPSQNTNFQFLDKKGQHKKVSLLCSLLKQNKSSNDCILMVKPENMRHFIIKQSIKHQVLCPLTAFACINKNIQDSQAQSVKDTGQVVIKVPQYAVKNTNVFQTRNSNNFARRNSMIIQSYQRLKDQVQIQQYYRPRRSITSSTRALKYHVQQDNQKLQIASQLQTNRRPKGIFGFIKNSFNFIGQAFLELGKMLGCQQRDTSPSPIQSKNIRSSNNIIISNYQPLQTDQLKKNQCPTMNTEPRSNDNILIRLQNMDGSWNEKNSSEIMNLVKIDQTKFKQVLIKYKHCELILTILMITHLQSTKDAKFNLIIKKAKEWIKLKSTQWAISEQDYKNIQSVI